MPDTQSSTSFPEFPTTWGEAEQKRLQELQEQQSKLTELWHGKFAPQAWEETPAIERGWRSFISETPIEKIAGFVSPWKWGYDYGVVPSTAAEWMQKTETELNTLLRRQRVVSSLPLVLDT